MRGTHVVAEVWVTLWNPYRIKGVRGKHVYPMFLPHPDKSLMGQGKTRRG